MNPENNTPKYVDTPRWGAVEISEVFNDPLQAAIISRHPQGQCAS